MKPTAIQKALSPPSSSFLPLGERRAVEKRKRDKGPDLGKRCKRRRRRRRRSKTPFPDIRPFVQQSRAQFMSFTSGLFGGARIVCTFIGSSGNGKIQFWMTFSVKTFVPKLLSLAVVQSIVFAEEKIQFFSCLLRRCPIFRPSQRTAFFLSLSTYSLSFFSQRVYRVKELFIFLHLDKKYKRDKNYGIHCILNNLALCPTF